MFMFFAVNPYSMFSAAKEKFPSVQLLDNKDYLILSYLIPKIDCNCK